jgi:phenylpropionate dioxygenase-like ring-hydroxylating dioxygenase large terminal subunit
MRCQYHGWEYGHDGFTRKIPCAKDFAPFDRNKLRLPEYRIDSIGQLVFVSLSHEAQSLVEQLGPIAGLVAERFGPDWRRFYKGQFDFEANWKVAIENSLEAYHVESIHPNTFRNAPSEERSEHQIHDCHTSFSTDMPFAAHHPTDRWFQKSEAWLVRRLGRTALGRYQQHHVFPNLLFSFTDAISLVHYVQPITATNSRSLLFQFGVYPQASKRWQRLLAQGLGNLETMILKRIMNEDLQMYPMVQRGLKASSHRGLLARSEERIYAFQSYLAKAMQRHASKDIPGLNSAEGYP